MDESGIHTILVSPLQTIQAHRKFPKSHLDSRTAASNSNICRQHRCSYFHYYEFIWLICTLVPLPWLRSFKKTNKFSIMLLKSTFYTLICTVDLHMLCNSGGLNILGNIQRGLQRWSRMCCQYQKQNDLIKSLWLPRFTDVSFVNFTYVLSLCTL